MNSRWRRVLKIEHQEYRKKGNSFNLKRYKKAYIFYHLAKREGLTNESLDSFIWRITVNLSRGHEIVELTLSKSKLEKHLKRIAESRCKNEQK